MSEVTSRPTASRGRGSGRGGRGGYAGRSGGRKTNGDKADHKADDTTGAFDDEGDFAELKQQYGSKTSVIREMFPDWSEVDVLFALQETNGDENEAVTRIAEGTISQWGEVSKTKKAPKTKTKDSTTAPTSTDSGARPPRKDRVVSEASRGKASKPSDRGGRAGRGRSVPPTANGTRNKENQQLSIPTQESSAWGDETTKATASTDETANATTAATEAPKPAGSAPKTWASMLRQSAPPKPAPKPKEAPIPQPSEQTDPIPAESTETGATAHAPEEETTPVVEQATPAVPSVVEPEIALPPSNDELTRTNLEQVVDESHPPATATAASTAADSWDPRQNPSSVNATPISAAQQQHQAQQAPPSGYAAAAMKATTDRTRPTSFQRRVLDQQEAVRMPGNREVDRAAVQFGAFNLGDGEEDVDGEREEAETRGQPPAESPVAHPRTALPPASQTAAAVDTFQQKPAASTGPAPGMPAPSLQSQASSNMPGQQYGRFGQAGAQDAPAAQQKPLDPFSQQTPSSQAGFDSYNPQTTQAQQPSSAFASSGPTDYGSYYGMNQQERNQYNNYYGQQYGQQASQSQQDGPASQQRPFGGYGSSQQSDNLSQYPQSGVSQGQNRFGAATSETQNSGHNTPNPTAQGQQQPPSQQQQGGPGSQPQSHGQYPGYNHPYYSNPYYHQYYSGAYSQGNFGPYGGKGGGMYGQPYGVSPNAPYEQHASSPGSFGQSSLHRDSGMGSSLGDYSRGGSGQAGSQPGLGGNSFGGMHDSFSRGASSFQSQGQGFGSQAQSSSSNDDLKPFGDKAGSGPSPALGGARPGSATNTASSGQSGLPPPQNAQMGAGYGSGYPSHLQGHGGHGSNAYGMGGAGGGNQHGNTPYGSYGQGFGGGSGGGYYGGGQQQRGWGGNYH